MFKFVSYQLWRHWFKHIYWIFHKPANQHREPGPRATTHNLKKKVQNIKLWSICRWSSEETRKKKATDETTINFVPQSAGEIITKSLNKSLLFSTCITGHLAQIQVLRVYIVLLLWLHFHIQTCPYIDKSHLTPNMERSRVTPNMGTPHNSSLYIELATYKSQVERCPPHTT